jgi:hypothetical protein
MHNDLAAHNSSERESFINKAVQQEHKHLGKVIPHWLQHNALEEYPYNTT